MNTTNAIIEEAPVLSTGEQLAKYSVRVAVCVNRMLEQCGDQTDPIAIASYIAVSRGQLTASVADLESILVNISDDDFESATKYITTVVQRRMEGAFDALTEGKPSQAPQKVTN